MNEKKISVIVPLYNTARLVGQCLESLTAQTHENLEIIVVDDGSTDGSADEVRRYMARDGRIRLLEHGKNRGLFRARLTGVEAAVGDYVGFVDSDDRVSRDYLRSLLLRAVECGSDITAGRLVHERADGTRYVHNRYHLYDPGVLEGEEARRRYFEQAGYCFIWHTVWNKLYSASLWRRALPYLTEVQGHLVMCEDLLISTVLFSLCERLSFTEYGRYYYRQHEGASTASGGGYVKYQKNVSDLIYAFAQTERMLERLGGTVHRESFKKWKRLYKHFWIENVKSSGLSPLSKRRLCSELELLCEGECEPPSPSYFYTSETDYDGRYEDILDAMISENVGAVSFDIFDTLITRPFYTPSDMFYLLNGDFSALCPSDGRLFSDIRISAERELREALGKDGSRSEEVTLAEIYERIGEAVGTRVADRMMSAEIDLELSFCRPRRSVQNLYRAALEAGKRIFFTSDMYLPPEVIRAMLNSCGYSSGELLLSCEEGVTKQSGRLFSLLIKRSGVSPNRIMHLGDSWESDYKRAKERGIGAVFYPAAVACLEYDVTDVRTTHTGVCYTEPSGSFINYERGFNFLGTRTAFATAAYRLYDNPFESYSEHSEMNASPTFLGYYALGMHLLGFTAWLGDSFSERDYGSAAFIARDGYLPMRAYELLRDKHPALPEPKYVYTSRKAALLCEIDAGDPIGSLCERLEPTTLAPRRLCELLSPLIGNKISSARIGASLPFGTRERLRKFLKSEIEPYLTADAIEDYKSTVADYLRSELTEKCSTVDVGYSARTQELIYRLTGISADAYYLHVNGDEAYRRADACGFSVHTFYGYSPSVTGAVRELLFSKPAPSAIGYRREGKRVVPVFEREDTSYPERYLIEELQRAALSFVGDFLDLFSDRLELMKMRSTDVSLPLEYFIHTLTDEDARLFDCILFEDDMWAGGRFSLPEAWRADIAYHGTVAHYLMSRDSGSAERAILDEYYRRGIHKKGAIPKLVFWLTHDRHALAEKLKRKLTGGRRG